MDTADLRYRYCYLAKVAEQTERFEEMVNYMKEVVNLSSELSVEERNQLSVAYKNVIGSRRASWRIITSLQSKMAPKDLECASAQVNELRKKVEGELSSICNDVLSLIDNKLLASNPNLSGESKVFYQKMKGDYHRYIAEFSSEKDRSESAKDARKAYEEASKLSAVDLPPTHPIRLGLALNFSVFHYEINNSPELACKLAKQAFDDAIAELDTLSEESYKDSTLIMQLLRDNLTLWTSDADNQEAQPAEKPTEETSPVKN